MHSIDDIVGSIEPAFREIASYEAHLIPDPNQEDAIFNEELAENMRIVIASMRAMDWTIAGIAWAVYTKYGEHRDHPMINLFLECWGNARNHGAPYSRPWMKNMAEAFDYYLAGTYEQKVALLCEQRADGLALLIPQDQWGDRANEVGIHDKRIPELSISHHIQVVRHLKTDEERDATLLRVAETGMSVHRTIRAVQKERTDKGDNGGGGWRVDKVGIEVPDVADEDAEFQDWLSDLAESLLKVCDNEWKVEQFTRTVLSLTASYGNGAEIIAGVIEDLGIKDRVYRRLKVDITEEENERQLEV